MVMDAAKLKELADRCEAATGPDIDRQTRRLLVEAFARIWGDYGGLPIFWNMLDAKGYLDAAMTLVPEGWRLSTLAESLTAGSSGGTRAAVLTRDDGSLPAIAFAHSLAHALCAAALRARALSLSDQQSEAA
jgi:hypothetical protein